MCFADVQDPRAPFKDHAPPLPDMGADDLMVRQPPPPEAQARGRAVARVGRLQRAVLRALRATQAQALKTSELLPWCFPREISGQYRQSQRWNVRRAARRFAVRVNGRSPREAIWRLKDGVRQQGR